MDKHEKPIFPNKVRLLQVRKREHRAKGIVEIAVVVVRYAHGLHD